MKTTRRAMLTLCLSTVLLGAIASSSMAATLAGTWKTSCTSYYYDVLSSKGACTLDAVPTATGLTQLPATLQVAVTNRGQTQGTNGAAYCALPTACPGTATKASARLAQSTSQCIVPAGMQALQTQALGGGRFRAGLLAIGWLFNPSGLSAGACTIAPALSSIQLAKNGRSFVISYTGFRRKSPTGGYTYGAPFTFRVRYDRLYQAPK